MGGGCGKGGGLDGVESVEGREGFNVDLAAGFGEREEVEVRKRRDGSLLGNQYIRMAVGD